VLGGDDEVAGEDDLEASAHRGAVDGGDDRLGEVAADDPGEAAGDAVDRVGLARLDRLEVHARREDALAGAGQDDRPGGVVALQLVEGGGERLARLEVDGVGAVGPVDRDHPHALLLPLGDRHCRVSTRSEPFGKDRDRMLV
jgi:hypothetical protein